MQQDQPNISQYTFTLNSIHIQTDQSSKQLEENATYNANVRNHVDLLTRKIIVIYFVTRLFSFSFRIARSPVCQERLRFRNNHKECIHDA